MQMLLLRLVPFTADTAFGIQRSEMSEDLEDFQDKLGGRGKDEISFISLTTSVYLSEAQKVLRLLITSGTAEMKINAFVREMGIQTRGKKA